MFFCFFSSEYLELQNERQLCGFKVDFIAANWLKCCFTSTKTVGLLGTGVQDGHLDFHTAPELENCLPFFCSFKSKVAAARVCVCSFCSTFSASPRHNAAAASSCRISAMILKLLNTLEREGTAPCDRLLLFVRVSVFGPYSYLP